ncbi:hypothetical protein PsYK624_042020 [Phanerochaete sordida]|uniref:Uncharacterized protein n=1 Tax=Phanerochaete sordida TaxID=48140 RepID=A0A9P3LB24_9APHY|nr:hypothetical protein PsYK624_042020 [Phanerochaete sordida]
MSLLHASSAADLQAILAYQEHQLRLHHQENEAVALETECAAAAEELQEAHAAFAETMQGGVPAEDMYAARTAWLRAKERFLAVRARAADAPANTLQEAIERACAEDPQFRVQFEGLDPRAAREAIRVSQAAAAAELEAQIRSLERGARM